MDAILCRNSAGARSNEKVVFIVTRRKKWWLHFDETQSKMNMVKFLKAFKPETIGLFYCEQPGEPLQREFISFS